MKNYYRILSSVLLFALPFLMKAQAGMGVSNMGSGMGGLQPNVKALACVPSGYYNTDTVYAGGNFTTADGLNARNIAKWDGYWHNLGSGVNNEVDAIATFNNKVYAGGKFDSAGGVLTHYIACWNGTQWDSVLGGLNGNVYALTVYQNALYVGGNFTTAGGIRAKHIAKWNGANWDSVGAGFDTTVYALTIFNNTLYAGGAFLKTKSNPVNHIAKWNGISWDSLSQGMNNIVYALDSFYHNLYAGGAFTMAGGNSANYIAEWAGGSWLPLLSGTNDTVRALGRGIVNVGVIIRNIHPYLTYFSPYLLVGGNFTKAGDSINPYMAFWDGQYWDSLGNVDNPVFSICDNSLNDHLASNVYIGGTFDSAYQSPHLNYIGQIDVNDGSGVNAITHSSSISTYPNPSNGIFNVEVANGHQLSANSQIEVYNMLGEKVYSSSISNPTTQYSIDLSNQPAGIYLCRLLGSDGTLAGSEKIIIR